MANLAVLTAALLVIAACSSVGVVRAQTECIGDLLPCASYLNTTGRPPSDCCSGIQKVIDTQLACLCSVYRNPSLVAGINVTQALQLPSRCNINADITACNALASAPVSRPPPATPGGNGNGNSGTGSRVPWFGMPVLVLASAVALLHH